MGVAAAAKPAPEIDNRFEEAGGKASPGPATKHAHTPIPPLRLTLKEKETGGKASPGTATKHAHTLIPPLRLTLKEKDAGHEEGAIQKNPFWDKTIKTANRALLLN